MKHRHALHEILLYRGAIALAKSQRELTGTDKIGACGMVLDVGSISLNQGLAKYRKGRNHP